MRLVRNQAGPVSHMEKSADDVDWTAAPETCPSQHDNHSLKDAERKRKTGLECWIITQRFKLFKNRCVCKTDRKAGRFLETVHKFIMEENYFSVQIFNTDEIYTRMRSLKGTSLRTYPTAKQHMTINMETECTKHKLRTGEVLKTWKLKFLEVQQTNCHYHNDMLKNNCKKLVL